MWKRVGWYTRDGCSYFKTFKLSKRDEIFNQTGACTRIRALFFLWLPYTFSISAFPNGYRLIAEMGFYSFIIYLSLPCMLASDMLFVCIAYAGHVFLASTGKVWRGNVSPHFSSKPGFSTLCSSPGQNQT